MVIWVRAILFFVGVRLITIFRRVQFRLTTVFRWVRVTVGFGLLFFLGLGWLVRARLIRFILRFHIFCALLIFFGFNKSLALLMLFPLLVWLYILSCRFHIIFDWSIPVSYIIAYCCSGLLISSIHWISLSFRFFFIWLQ